jgi:hypothetical protein
MVQPRAQRLERIQLWMIRKNDNAPPKATRLPHNRSPEFKQVFQPTPTRSMTTQNIAGNSLLRDYVD